MNVCVSLVTTEVPYKQHVNKRGIRNGRFLFHLFNRLKTAKILFNTRFSITYYARLMKLYKQGDRKRKCST